jgi:hypothetical protein
MGCRVRRCLKDKGNHAFSPGILRENGKLYKITFFPIPFFLQIFTSSFSSLDPHRLTAARVVATLPKEHLLKKTFNFFLPG